MFSIVQGISAALRPASNDHSFPQKEKGGKSRARRTRPADDDHNDTDDAGRGYTNIGVRPLILYLEDYLENLLGGADVPFTQKGGDSAFSSIWHKDAVNGNQTAAQSDYVNKAYRHAAEAKADSGLAPESYYTQRNQDQMIKDGYIMLRRLRDMRAAGITDLSVRNDLPFLESVLTAISEMRDDV